MVSFDLFSRLLGEGCGRHSQLSVTMSQDHSPMDVDGGEKCYESTKRKRGSRKKKLLVNDRVEVMPRLNLLFCFFVMTIFIVYGFLALPLMMSCSVLCSWYVDCRAVCVFMGFVLFLCFCLSL